MNWKTLLQGWPTTCSRPSVEQQNKTAKTRPCCRREINFYVDYARQRRTERVVVTAAISYMTLKIWRICRGYVEAFCQNNANLWTLKDSVNCGGSVEGLFSASWQMYDLIHLVNSEDSMEMERLCRNMTMTWQFMSWLLKLLHDFDFVLLWIFRRNAESIWKLFKQMCLEAVQKVDKTDSLWTCTLLWRFRGNAESMWKLFHKVYKFMSC